MKKKVLAIITMVLVFTACIANPNKDIKVYYVNNQGEKVLLRKESFYDVEEKPTVYYIENPDDRSIYIIEVYRIIDSKEHFYRSFSLSKLDIKHGFDVSGIFADITSPFIISSGFIIRLCKIDKNYYLKLKNRTQCDDSIEYRILTSN